MKSKWYTRQKLAKHERNILKELTEGGKDRRLRKQITQRYKIPTFYWPVVTIATTAIILLTFL